MSALTRRCITPVIVGIITYAAVCVAPFFIPVVHTLSVSASNDADFNNKAASALAGVSAVCVFALAWFQPQWFPARAQVPVAAGEGSLSRRLFYPVFALVLAGTATAEWLVHIAHVRYARDAGYFLNQLTSSAVYHRKLWSEIELPYGPLLFFPPIELQRLLGVAHLSLQTCYFLLLLAEQAVGLGLLLYLVERLPLSRTWRVVAFVACTSLTVDPLLGMNYTLFRFLAPFAALLFSVRRRTSLQCALCLCIGGFFTMSISPEIGFAFTAGAVAYSAVRVWREGRTWLPAVFTAPVGALLLLVLAGAPFLRMLGLFAGGTLNLIVRPRLYVVCFLIALVWLVPVMLAQKLRAEEHDTTLLGSLFVVAVALVPVALGRCDSPHVLFNGAGLFLLACVAASRLARVPQWLWGVCLFSTVAVGMGAVINLGLPQLRQTLEAAARHRQHLPPLEPAYDLTPLLQATGEESVATPEQVDLSLEEALQQSGLYRPSFYYYMEAVLDQRAERRKIAEFNQAKWALLPPETPFVLPAKIDVQVFPGRFGRRRTHASYIPGLEFRDNLRANWRPVGHLQQYILYQHIGPH